jgi:hypothetical protein
MSVKTQVLNLIDKALDKWIPTGKKTFDGEVYTLEEIFSKKESAEWKAEQLRKKGYLCRVDDRTGSWHHWYVWTRRK